MDTAVPHLLVSDNAGRRRVQQLPGNDGACFFFLLSAVPVLRITPTLRRPPVAIRTAGTTGGCRRGRTRGRYCTRDSRSMLKTGQPNGGTGRS